MSKAEFWTLNVVGSVCALLMLASLILGRMNDRLNQSALAVQNQFTEAQQVHSTVQNLVLRVAQDGRKDAALADLLARHDFKVNLPAPEATSR